MAASRVKGLAAGSAAWLQNERDQVAQIIEQEQEEFGFVVRNELDWLNEHMTDIFSRSNVDLKDIMKTPGKMRGKTPRTIRKQDAALPRQPLTDVFAPSLPKSSVPFAPLRMDIPNRANEFSIAEDTDVRATAQVQASFSRAKSPLRVGQPGYIDSGYHGMTEDELEGELEHTQSDQATQVSMQRSQSQTHARPEAHGPLAELGEQTTTDRPSDLTEGGPASDESFLSAEEELSRQAHSGANTVVDEIAQPGPEPMHNAASDTFSRIEKRSSNVSQDKQQSTMPSSAASGRPYTNLSPEQSDHRKSSFAFASLPARETRLGGRSTGIRESHLDGLATRHSVIATNMAVNKASLAPEDVMPMQQEENLNEKVVVEPKSLQPRPKTSTQLLQERITLLGKVKSAKSPTEEIGIGATQQVTYPLLPEPVPRRPAAEEGRPEQAGTSNRGDDQPLPEEQGRPFDFENNQHYSPIRSPIHHKSASTLNMVTTQKVDAVTDSNHKKTASMVDLAYSVLQPAGGSTTPAGSPLAKRLDGTLSASKNRFWSAVKSAKSIFASSGNASAAAKLESHDTSPVMERSPQRPLTATTRPFSIFNMSGANQSEHQLAPSPSRSIRTRSSNESERRREKGFKAQQKSAEALEKAREQERRTVAKQKAEPLEHGISDAVYPTDEDDASDRAQHLTSVDDDQGPSKTGTVSHELIEAKIPVVRSVKQIKPESQKPAPASVRLASQRIGQSAARAQLSKSQHEPVPAYQAPKTHLRTNSAQSNISASLTSSNARAKALEAAARRKEAEDRANQKKVEQKREMERRRLAKVEEERRTEEERKMAEQQRLLEARQAAQRKAEQQAALEARKKEQMRLEQIRQEEEEAQKAKAAQEAAESAKRKQQQAAAQARNEVGGTLRQLNKNTSAESMSRSIIQMNPAKPVKRVFGNEEEDVPSAVQRPGVAKGPVSYEQNDAKRRRTNEEHEGHDQRPPVMAPPKRPSYLRKESTLSKFPHGYAHTHVPPNPVAHPSVTLFKTTTNPQHTSQHMSRPPPIHPSQTVQMSNARIPFADNGHVPTHLAVHNTYDPSKFRTPARPVHGSKSAKSSPLYTNPDNIQLPEIQTDSEDEESDEEGGGNTGFRVPSWVASPALRDLLTQQQLIDPESVFGPIGELKMEEVFKNGKQDRLKRFRERGSSAAWVESGDAVTSAEKRRDMEARERVAREGGWTFRPAI